MFQRSSFVVPACTFVLSVALSFLVGPPRSGAALRPAGAATGAPCVPGADWTSEFQVGALGSAITAKGDPARVVLGVAKGKPMTVTLPKLGEKTFKDPDGNDVLVRIYDGFPIGKIGRASTGVGMSLKGRGADGDKHRNHFGYWVVVTTECCKESCFIQLILKSERRIVRQGQAPIVLADVQQPVLDEGTIDQATRPCGEPSFVLNPDPKGDRKGFFDAPGLPGVAGDEITVGANVVTLQAGDRITIKESFRTFITCKGHYIGFVDWGWEGQIDVRNNVNRSELTIEGNTATFTGIGDPGFQPAVDQAQVLTQ